VAASIDGVATVYAASLTNPPGLYRSANGGNSWDNVADDAYRRQAFLPHELAVAGDGRLYVALDGMGVLVGAVPTAPRPRNDSFATPTAVTGALPAVSGTTIGATKESGEGSHAGNAGGSSVWFTWRAPASGTTTITTAGSRFDTLLGVYKGTALASLVPVDSNDDTSSSDTSSTATFAAQAGTTYRIAVDGKGGASGPFTLTWAVTAKDSAFSPRTATTAGPGSSVLWAFVGPRLHSVTSSLPPFDSGPKGPGERFSFRFPAAGTFPYRSGLDGTTMTGTVAVPVVVSPARGTRTTPFLVTWASDPPPAGAVFDVRTRAPGSTTWRSWETGVTATSATFVPPPGSRTGAYSFSARLRVGAGTSGWSPPRTVQVA
jgi:plastocyanin